MVSKIKINVLKEEYIFYVTSIMFKEGASEKPYCYIRKHGDHVNMVAIIENGNFILETPMELGGRDWSTVKKITEIKIPKSIKIDLTDYYPRSILNF